MQGNGQNNNTTKEKILFNEEDKDLKTIMHGCETMVLAVVVGVPLSVIAVVYVIKSIF